MTRRDEIVAQKRAAIEKKSGPLTDAIEDHGNQLTQLYADRLKLWKEAIKVGFKHREIAEMFRVSVNTVSVALHKEAKR